MISAIILARNEEKNLEELIPSLSFCDEVIVVDNDSTDKTADVAKKMGAHLISNSSTNFSTLRNTAQKKAKHEWILFVDADERISKLLQDEILAVVNAESSHVAWYIPRIDIFWKKEVKYGELLGARLKGILRLVKKDGGKWQGNVHEIFVPKGSTGTLKEHIIHHSHAGIADFLDTVNIFSTRRAEELYKSGTRLWALHIVAIPFAKFFYTYVLLGGFLDGARGFVYSFMMSFHSFLTRSKVYLLQNR